MFVNVTNVNPDKIHFTTILVNSEGSGFVNNPRYERHWEENLLDYTKTRVLYQTLL